MGPEVALALLAGGTGLSMLGQRRAANERRDILNRQFERTNSTMDKTTGQILGEGKNYTPDQRMRDMQTQEDATFGQSQKDLNGAGAGVLPTSGDAGNVSQDFLRAKADRTLSEGNRMTAIARELAKVRAPGQQMATEGLRRADVTGDVASQWGSNRAFGDAANLDAQSVQEPWWGTLGKIGQQVGMMGAMGGMGGLGGGPGAVTGGGGLKVPTNWSW